MPRKNKLREKSFADKLFERIALHPQDWLESERPDSCFSLGNKKIGMEITESTPSETYWGADIANKLTDNNPSHILMYSSSYLCNHSEERLREDLFQDMFNNPNYVYMAESRRWWCENVKVAWDNKRKKLNEDNYKQLDENWLLIWDNVGLQNDYSTVTNIQDEVCKTSFFDINVKDFDRVYVLSGDYTFEFIPCEKKVGFIHEYAEKLNLAINS